MNQNIKSLRSSPLRANIFHAFGSLSSTAGEWMTAARKRGANFTTQIQIGRMRSALNSLSCEQLDQIGLKRGDINRRAEYLVTYKYDGL
jgi:uncharacterized protein YjiS (DUF1127 family)